MLTDSEREWLKKKERILREGKVWGAWCYACPNFGRDWAECYAHQYCPIFNSHEALQDAALFEARVAAKLATYATMMVGSDIAAPCLECPCQKAGVCYHGTNKSCQWSFLTTARLQVEEEMDNEMD